MNILLQINSVVNSGSTGRIVEEIGQVSMENGWKSIIAYGRYDLVSKSELIRIGSEFDVNLHGLQTRLFDRHGLGSYSATKKLITQIKKIRPNIIHLHNLHGYYLNIKLLFEYLATSNIPVVWTFHDCWPITGHCVHFDFAGCYKWKDYCHKCPQLHEYPASLFFDNSKNNYLNKKELFSSINNLTIVTVSSWLASVVSESFLNIYPIQVIPNGVNISIFKPVKPLSFLRKLDLRNKFILLGVANEWSSRKGLIDYISLSKLLPSDFQIILIGLSEKQLVRLPSNIIGIRRTENIDELVELYSIADIVLNLSYEESFGLTTIEGFACGTPGIVYNTTASPELITSETGYVVEKGDINNVVRVIYELKQKGKKSFTSACVNRAHIVYDKNNCFKKYLNLYKKLIFKHNDFVELFRV